MKSDHSIARESEKDARDLFRTEAISELSHGLGSVFDIKTVPAWIITFFFCLLFSVATIFLSTVKYAHKENVSGQVSSSAGSLRITAGRNGMIDEVFVKDGSEVKSGQELMRVSSAPNLELGVSLGDSIKEMQDKEMHAQKRQLIGKLEQLGRQIDEIKERKNSINGDIVRLRTAAQMQTARVGIQERALKASVQLGEHGMISPMAIQTKEDDLLVARQSLATIEREQDLQTSLSAQLAVQIERVKAEKRVTASEGDSIDAQALQRRLISAASYSDHIVAAVDGYVTALQAHVGAPVSANQTLAIIVPKTTDHVAGELEVELWAPSKAVGMLRPGMKVNLMFDAFPYQTFGVSKGTIVDIAMAPVAPGDLPYPTESKELMYRVRVSSSSNLLNAYGKEWKLSPGMRLTADLILEERLLIQWIVDPLHAAFKTQN